MSDPTLALHKGIVAAIRADAALLRLIGGGNGRVFDAPSPDAKKPYVVIGHPQVLPDKATCVKGAEVLFPVHGWAEGPATEAIKTLGPAIVAALDANDEEPTKVSAQGFRVLLFQFDQVQYLPDPNPATQHVIVTFRALTEPA